MMNVIESTGIFDVFKTIMTTTRKRRAVDMIDDTAAGFNGLTVWTKEIKPILQKIDVLYAKEVAELQWLIPPIGRVMMTTLETKYGIAEKKDKDSALHFIMQIFRLPHKAPAEFKSDHDKILPPVTAVRLGQIAYNFGQLQTCERDLPLPLASIYDTWIRKLTSVTGHCIGNNFDIEDKEVIAALAALDPR